MVAHGNALIECSGVTKAFGGVVANNEITLSVPEGRITGLIGPNGSGKTTLFNSIVGYHPIDAGSIRFRGREISRLLVPQIARMGLVRTFQQTRIYSKMNCVDNMLISLPHRHEGYRSMFTRYPPQAVQRAEELLEFVGLYQKRYLICGDLSFGQQKLLEFAMALMSEPEVLLLDEPTAGINPTLINGLIDRLKRDMAGEAVTAELALVRGLAEQLAVEGTPFFIVGDTVIPGAPESLADMLRSAIDTVRTKGCRHCKT